MLASDLYSPEVPYVTWVDADATNIYFTVQKDTVSSQTIYFRLYGFKPKSYTGDVDFTASQSLYPFVLNTDLNYLKLYLDDVITASANDTVSHNLGYKPVTMLWQEDSIFHANSIHPISQPVLYDSTSSISRTPIVGDNTITFPTAGKYYYRIYIDDYDQA